jgi:Mn2+/Fe2+ NRAMP family transporter
MRELVTASVSMSAGTARFLSTLGPGLLWAAAAIGVSHLVQSTRAGADGGFSLLWIIVLALLIKYPFFEYGPRYAAATGESLVEGYYRLGRWALYLYMIITLLSAVIVQSAVTLFTALIFANILNLAWPVAAVSALILTGCALLLRIGRFQALDISIKAILIILVLCTLTGAAMTVPQVADSVFTPWPLADTPAVHWIFILALVGWMPSAIDISVWSSLWTLAKNKVSGAEVSVTEALRDFRIGYIGTGIIALAFLTLGATVMYSADVRFSPQGAAFAFQLVDLFSETLGAWTRPVILMAVLATMFSTTLAVVDGFPRAIARSLHTIRNGVDATAPKTDRCYWAALVVLALATTLVLAFFVGNLTTMVDFATLLAFTTAPVLGYLNLRAVTLQHVAMEMQPGKFLQAFSWFGLALMGMVALLFLASLVLTG